MTDPALSARPSTGIQRVSRRIPCPICGKTNWCNLLGNWGVHCERIEAGSRKPAHGSGWIHVLDGHEPDWNRNPPAPPPAPRRPTGDAEVLDRAYRVLLAHCPLAPADHDHLQQRGLSDEQITRHGYATLPDDHTSRAHIIAAVLAELEQDPGGVVPGFIRQQTTTTLVGLAGILIPFRDTAGRIAGLQVRMRQPRDGAKYRWFSAGDGPGSMGQNGNTVHVAQPLGALRNTWVVITEGAIKANIVADHFGCRVLAVAGVSNTGDVMSMIGQLRDVTKVVIAYDADADQNPHVLAAEAKLACACAEAGLQVAQWQWTLSDGKGIDDLLRTGNLLPFPIPHPALASCPASGAPSPIAPEDPARLQKLQKLHALSTQAHRSPNLGAERHVLTDLVLTLAAVPEGEVIALPYSRLADLAKVSTNTVVRSLGKAGIRPKDGEAGLFDGLITVDVRPVPERRNTQTGEITGGYEAMHISRLAPVSDLLERIAQAPVPAAGPRNGHGGKRCTHCGHTQVKQTITEHCAGCGTLIRQTQRLVDRGHEDPPPHDGVESMRMDPDVSDGGLVQPPPRPTDAITSTSVGLSAPDEDWLCTDPPSHDGGAPPSAGTDPRDMELSDTRPSPHHGVEGARLTSWGEDDPLPVTYLWDPMMGSTPPPHDGVGISRDQRKACAARSLAAWQDRHPTVPPNASPDTQVAAEARTATPQLLPLFALTPAEACVTCGNVAVSGQAHCHSCDPRGG